MAPSTKTRKKHRYADFDEYVDYQLQKTCANLKALDILSGLLAIVTLVLGYLLVFVVSDQWLVPGGFGYWPRMILLSVVFLAVSWLFVHKVLFPGLRHVTRLFAADTLESQVPELNNGLLNLVDLERTERPVSPSVALAIEKRAAVTLSQVDVDQAVDRRPLLRISYALLAIVVAFCLYTVFSPKRISPSVWRALLPKSDVSVATKTEIHDVRPGDTEVLQQSQLEVVCDIRGTIPEHVKLIYTSGDRRYVDEPLEMRETEEGLKRYQVMLTGDNGRGLLQDMTYYIVAGDARTRDFTITVIQPPSATVDRLRYQFPSYMELEDQTQEGGHIDTWEATNVTIQATANMPVKSARLLFSDSDDQTVRAEEMRMEITDGIHLSAEWKAAFRSDGSYPHYYRIQCENERGDVDPEPTLYPIAIHPDQPPEVMLLDPTADLQRPANAVVPLVIQAQDPDFQLTYLILRFEKDGEELSVSRHIFEGRQQAIRITYDFQLEPLHLDPGDILSYWIEARDNKRPISNRTNTPKRNIQILEPVSEQEAQQQRDQDRERQQQMQEPAGGSGTGGDEHSTEQSPDVEKAADPETDQAGDETSSGSEDQPSQEQEPGTEDANSDEDPHDAAEQNETQRKLRNDGSDDEDVLRRLLEREQQQSDRQQDDQTDPAATNQQPEPADADSSNDHTGAARGAPTQNDSPSSDNSRSPDSGDGETNRQNRNTAEPSHPSDTPSANDASPGQGSEPDDRSKPDGPAGSSNGSDANSNESPAEDSNDAIRKKAQGDEEGVGTPDTDPNADPTRATKEIQRKLGTEPHTQQNSTAQPDETPTKPAASDDSDQQTNSKNGDSEKQNSPNANQNSQPSGSGDSTRDAMPKTGQPGSANPSSKEGTGSQSSGASKSHSPQENGSQGDSQQKSPKSGNSTDASPGTQPNDQHEGGQNGDSNSSDSQSRKDGSAAGKSSDSPETKSSQSAGDEKGESGSKSSQQQSSESKQPGPAGGEPAKQGSAGGAGEQGSGGGDQNDSADATGSQGGSGAHRETAPEDANLEFSKQAVDLVLKRLQKELDRGEVDRELLDELGWTEEDIRRFTHRLEEQLHDSGQDESAESIARRRQFEAMLENLKLRDPGTERSDSRVRKRSIRDTASRRLPVPVEYRDLYEAFTRSLSKRAPKSRQTSGEH